MPIIRVLDYYIDELKCLKKWEKKLNVPGNKHVADLQECYLKQKADMLANFQLISVCKSHKDFTSQKNLQELRMLYRKQVVFLIKMNFLLKLLFFALNNIGYKRFATFKYEFFAEMKRSLHDCKHWILCSNYEVALTRVESSFLAVENLICATFVTFTSELEMSLPLAMHSYSSN